MLVLRPHPQPAPRGASPRHARAHHRDVRDVPPHAFQLDRGGAGRAGGRRGVRRRPGCGRRGGTCEASCRTRQKSQCRCGDASAREEGAGEAHRQGRRQDRQAHLDRHEKSHQEEVTQAAVKVDRLEKTLGSNKVLRGITFEAHSGEIFGLLGPNGAGKTTTLRVICTLLAPDSGSVEVLGYDTRVSPQEVRRRVGVVTAEIGIYPRLSARENIAYFAELTGVLNGEVKRRVDGVIDRLDMGSFAEQRAESLSSGQKQKVAIARAIVHDPPVLMFDEPTSNLDVLASREIREFMVESKDRGKSVIFSTHVLHDAERLCDRLTIIHQGRVVASGATAEVRGAFKDLEDSFLSLVEAAG
ncbi:MAG: ABC transporter ATP-binding protein [Chloroflexi bacterium]|nr:MAG: ABC transporter ATP-binding protein [Chloroflexota bacterium]